MADTLNREFSFAEMEIIVEAMTRGTIRAADNRTDGCADCDGLLDARRIGERIADGFAILNAAHE